MPLLRRILAVAGLAALALLIGVLMVRPQGLFGRTRARQV